MMMSRQNYYFYSISMIILVSLFSNPCQTLAQHGYGGMSSPAVGSTAPGRLQPAYMPSVQMSASVTPMVYQAAPATYMAPVQTNYAQPQGVQHAFSNGYASSDSHVQSSMTVPTQMHVAANAFVPVNANVANYAPVQTAYYSPASVASSPSRYENAPQMVNSRVPRGNDLMAIDQHRMLQYRRMYRNGSTPQPSELAGQWNGVNKGIVQAAGYGQFIKDIRVGVNGQLHGDNVQVSQVKPGQVRLDGWQPKFDYATSDYERRGAFAVQAPNGRGFFGHGATFSYADGNNPANDPARLLKDQVVKIDGNHMLGRAVVEFGPIKIPLSYFVLERRQ